MKGAGSRGAQHRAFPYLTDDRQIGFRCGREAINSRARGPGSLCARFIVPPFTILDGRQGYWQKRKWAWLSLGIRGELGRGNDGDKTKGGLAFSLSSQPIEVFKKKGAYEEEVGRRVSWQEFAEARPEALRMHGTSVFDPVLCEVLYTWFCPAGGRVLDPFAGGSVRGVVAGRMGLAYTGIDLSARQIRSNRSQASRIRLKARPRWIVGDSRQVARLARGRCDFVFSCPPYGDLERYSDDPRDLSTMEYGAFRRAYQEIITGACRLLKDGRFACFVVGEIRNRLGFYRGFISDTIRAFARAGLTYYNEAVFVPPGGSLATRAGKQFDASRKLCRAHQHVLIFIKGPPQEAIHAVISRF